MRVMESDSGGGVKDRKVVSEVRKSSIVVL